MPAGWYVDPEGVMRWWDGRRWTEHTSPGAVPAAPPASPAPASPPDDGTTKVSHRRRYPMRAGAPAPVLVDRSRLEPEPVVPEPVVPEPVVPEAPVPRSEPAYVEARLSPPITGDEALDHRSWLAQRREREAGRPVPPLGSTAAGGVSVVAVVGGVGVVLFAVLALGVVLLSGVLT